MSQQNHTQVVFVTNSLRSAIFRFVALIPFERRAGVGGRRIESWQSWHAFLARGRGDVEDHATLLCSLLLGFGLSAYVVIGTAYDDSNATADSRRDHAWVCTRASNGDVVFIERWVSEP